MPDSGPGAAFIPEAGGGPLFNAFPPNTVIRRGPKKRTHDNTPTFRFRSKPKGSEAGFSCRLDRGEWSACASPYTLGPLTPRAHIFRVRSIGATNLADPSAAKRRFKVLAGSSSLGQKTSRPPE